MFGVTRPVRARDRPLEQKTKSRISRKVAKPAKGFLLSLLSEHCAFARVFFLLRAVSANSARLYDHQEEDDDECDEGDDAERNPEF